MLAACAADDNAIDAASPAAGKADEQAEDWPLAENYFSRLRTSQCRSFDAYAFPEQQVDEHGEPVDDVDPYDRGAYHTDGAVVIRGGKLVYDKYGRGYTPTMKHLSWSTAKSYVDALYGIAVQERRLAVTDRVADWYPTLSRALTLNDVLYMSSGIDWVEDYESNPIDSDVTKMLWVDGHRDMAGTVSRAPERAEGPAQRWQYNSGNSNLLMGVLKQIYGDEYDDMPWTKLFGKLDMDVTWEQDASGTFVGSSYLYATPRDMAKFGYLYLNDGVWKGERILPEGWVKATSTVAPAYRMAATEVADPLTTGVGGRHWWLNQDVAGRGKPYPDVPADMFAAMGHWGQYIIVIPSHDLVIVRTGVDRYGSGFDLNKFISLGIACAESGGPA